MLYYQEITLIDQVEISPYFIWSKLYGKLHIALVKIKKHNNQANIGVSFPQYVYQKEDGQKLRVSLGKKLRIFAQTEEELQQLNINKWFERLLDYLHIGTIRLVPQDRVTSYAIFQRRQVKSNAERLARHRVKTKKDIDFNTAIKLYQSCVTFTDLPFIQLKSCSTRSRTNSTDLPSIQLQSSTKEHHFRLFIQKNSGMKTDTYKFNTYGLSKESTVPEF